MRDMRERCLDRGHKFFLFFLHIWWNNILYKLEWCDGSALEVFEHGDSSLEMCFFRGNMLLGCSSISHHVSPDGLLALNLLDVKLCNNIYPPGPSKVMEEEKNLQFHFTCCFKGG